MQTQEARLFTATTGKKEEIESWQFIWLCAKRICKFEYFIACNDARNCLWLFFDQVSIASVYVACVVVHGNSDEMAEFI